MRQAAEGFVDNNPRQVRKIRTDENGFPASVGKGLGKRPGHSFPQIFSLLRLVNIIVAEPLNHMLFSRRRMIADRNRIPVAFQRLQYIGCKTLVQIRGNRGIQSPDKPCLDLPDFRGFDEKQDTPMR